MQERPMIDHVSLKVRDFKRSRAFYDAALKPLGASALWTFNEPAPHAGYGRPPRPVFWIAQGEPASTSLHVAFTAERRSDVDAFYAAAIAAGGQDNGPPGLRPDYHPDYYGAFVLDPDGVNVEAVCHGPA
jgi:catechol 2,3-dioxygenase-like lactoylglutathione lyase family enzyme